MIDRPRARLAAALSFVVAAPALAQTPARFPSIPEAQVEATLGNTYCAREITTIARTVAETEGWRGFGVRLCSPDLQPAGAIVAWQRSSGRREFVPTLPDGRLLPRPTQGDGTQVLGDQQSRAVLFGAPLRNGAFVGCWFSRNDRMNEPFAVAFCYRLDSNGRPLPGT